MSIIEVLPIRLSIVARNYFLSKDTFMNRISFNGSNGVGQQSGYRADWAASVDAVNAHYQPLATFPARFETFLTGIKALGFRAVDVWTAGQLNWAWATPEHNRIAHELLVKHGLSVTSLGGEFGETMEEFERACQMAVTLETRLLSGTLPLMFTDRAHVVARLKAYDLRLAIENHPERTPAEMLEKIGDGAGGRIGTCVDTGWYATQGYNPALAIHELRDHLLHIHLKNVLPGEDHLNTGYDHGEVDIRACLTALQDIDYEGDISVEDHATDHDPTEEIEQGRALVNRYFGT